MDILWSTKSHNLEAARFEVPASSEDLVEEVATALYRQRVRPLRTYILVGARRILPDCSPMSWVHRKGQASPQITKRS